MHWSSANSPTQSLSKTRKQWNWTFVAIKKLNGRSNKRGRRRKTGPRNSIRTTQICSNELQPQIGMTKAKKLHFINSNNVSLAQYKLIHQFKESRFPNVTFALGTTQALYLGDFFYANSSSPSNFTVFPFHDLEPNSSNQQTDYLICHLIQEQGQKKSIDNIKASLKQTVHVLKTSSVLGPNSNCLQ
jgi:hypothetical protein